MSQSKLWYSAVIVGALCLAGASSAIAQRYVTTLGSVVELRAQPEARGIIEGDFNGDNLTDIATFGGDELLVNFQERGTALWHSTTLVVGKPVVAAAAGPCNGDRFTDIVLMTDDPPEILVYLARASEKFVQVWKTELPALYGNVALADIDEDGKADILLYGKRHLGVTVMRGKGNGTFRPATVLLPENSFGALSVEDVNGDGVNDIVAGNWVSNQIMIFSGFGKSTFSEPSIIECPSEPRFFRTAFLNADPAKDLVVCLPELKLCRLYRGDGFGGFESFGEIALNSTPRKLEIGDVNGDGKEDIGILSAEKASLTIDLNNGEGFPADSVVYSAGLSPVDFAFINHGGTRLTDAVILDSAASRLRIFRNANIDQDEIEVKTYATGLNPSDAIAADFNHDGWSDIAVTNSGSKNISLFLNEGNGAFTGQISFRTTTGLRFLDYVPKNDSIAVFLGTNPDAPSTSIVEINTRSYAHSLVDLPTQGEQTILSARIDPSSQYLRLTVLEHDRPREGGELIEYEQIAPTRFIQRSVAARFDHALMAAAEYNRAGYRDIIALVRDPKRKMPLIYESFSGSDEKFGNPRLALTLDSSTEVPALLWTADLNHDSIPDLIVNLQSPENTLTVALGRRDTTFSPNYFKLHVPVSISSKDGLKIIDLNEDGNDDIVLRNDATLSIEVYYGLGDGTFAPGPHMISTKGLGGFALDDLDNDGVPELIVTEIQPGILKILSVEDRR